MRAAVVPIPPSDRGQSPAAADAPAPRVRASEATVVHTRILRCMLAADDCAAYWAHCDPSIPPSQRAEVAFRDRWFGVKSEARVRTILPDMTARFDAYPDALALLREASAGASPLPARLRPWICHLHTQLADPIYRGFTGDFLATRREQGLRTIDLEGVARWVNEIAPDRWSASTRTKFASNLLATAFDVGLVGARRDPRPLVAPSPPDVAIAYALYLLRGVAHAGTTLDNAYLRSIGVTPGAFASAVSRAPGIHFAQLGTATELTFEEPSLLAWGRAHLVEVS